MNGWEATNELYTAFAMYTDLLDDVTRLLAHHLFEHSKHTDHIDHIPYQPTQSIHTRHREHYQVRLPVDDESLQVILDHVLPDHELHVDPVTEATIKLHTADDMPVIVAHSCATLMNMIHDMTNQPGTAKGFNTASRLRGYLHARPDELTQAIQANLDRLHNPEVFTHEVIEKWLSRMETAIDEYKHDNALKILLGEQDYLEFIS